LDGFLCIDKPIGLTSFSIAKIAKKILNVHKTGHNGTLDPAASGLLIVASGKATRLLPFIPSDPKTYLFSIQFGRTTDTLDCDGKFSDVQTQIPDEKKLLEILPLFEGTITQKPPIFSAIKIKGKPAYSYARKNIEIIIPERKITIYSISLLHYNHKKGEAFLKTECSKGTYIRSLARDIAIAAGTTGYTTAIRRTAIHTFSVQNAATLAELKENYTEYIISINSMFIQNPSYTASEEEVKKLFYGQRILLNNKNEGTVFIYNNNKELIAVGNNDSDKIFHPNRVFITE